MINSISTSSVNSLYQTTSAVSTASAEQENASSASSISSSYDDTAVVYEPSGSVVSSEEDTTDDTSSSTVVPDEVTSEVASSTSSSSVSSTDWAKVATAAISSTVQQTDVNYMLNQAESDAQNFSVLISSTFSKQADKYASSSFFTGSNLKDMFENVTVDAQTVADAQALISEDGYFGVTQTAERISNLALAIAGDDPDKLAEMVTAIDKGFAMAASAWGDELPEISQQTYDQVMVNLGVSEAE